MEKITVVVILTRGGTGAPSRGLVSGPGILTAIGGAADGADGGAGGSVGDGDHGSDLGDGDHGGDADAGGGDHGGDPDVGHRRR